MNIRTSFLLLRILSVLWFLGFPSGIALPAELTGRVVGVTDGDTLTLLTDGKQQVRVRLIEIDAPESGQPWGQRSKEDLSALVFGQRARVIYTSKDQFGRTLGRVYVEGKDVNLEMVRIGAAWAYRQYLTDSSFFGVESKARAENRGLWSLPAEQRMPPWDWRQSGGREAVSVKSPSEGGQCGSKRYCGQMTSCAEARFYLNTCGVRSLDGTLAIRGPSTHDPRLPFATREIGRCSV